MSADSQEAESFQLKRLLLFERMYRHDSQATLPREAIQQATESTKASGQDSTTATTSPRRNSCSLPSPRPSPRESAISVLLADIPPSARGQSHPANASTTTTTTTGTGGPARRARPVSSYGGSSLSPSARGRGGFSGRGGSGGSAVPMAKEAEAASLRVWMDCGRTAAAEVTRGTTADQLIRQTVERECAWLGFSWMTEWLTLFWWQGDGEEVEAEADGSGNSEQRNVRWGSGPFRTVPGGGSVLAEHQKGLRTGVVGRWAVRVGIPALVTAQRNEALVAWVRWRLAVENGGGSSSGSGSGSLLGEFTDGVALIQLADALLGTQGGVDPLQKRKGGLLRWGHKRKPPSPKIKARSKAEKLANVDRALAAFKSHHYAICGDSVKILAGDTEEIAGVLWAIAWQSGYLLLLCLLQLAPPSTSPTQSSSATATPALRKRTSTSAAQTPATPTAALPDLFCFKAMLLRWMQLHFSSETALQLRVADFSPAWRSAMPIASLLLSFFPSCLKLDKIGLNRMENVSYILLNAARVGCPPILQPAYFDGPMLDEQAILLFLLALLQLTTPTSGSDPSSSSSSSSYLPSISSSS